MLIHEPLHTAYSQQPHFKVVNLSPPPSSMTLWLRGSRSSSQRVAAIATCHQRGFFLFPSPSQALVKSHSERKRVPFSRAEMFDVVADVDRYHEFLPFCVDSRVLRRPNDNVMEAALRVGFKVFTESYTSRVIMKRSVELLT